MKMLTIKEIMKYCFLYSPFFLIPVFASSDFVFYPVATISSENITGVIDISSGGTGASTALEARTSLGVAASGYNEDIAALIGGDIGIGTTSPQASLDVSGNVRIKSGLILTDLTISTVVYADENKTITSSSVTPTELGYLSGVIASVQTQLDSKSSAYGVTDASVAASGQDGENMLSVVESGAAISITTETQADVTSITLGAGDWDVTGAVIFSGGAITGTSFMAGFGTDSGTSTTGMIAGDNQFWSPIGPTAVSDAVITLPTWRVNSSSTVTIYLKAKSSFTFGSATAYGRISARRIR